MYFSKVTAVWRCRGFQDPATIRRKQVACDDVHELTLGFNVFAAIAENKKQTIVAIISIETTL